MIGRDCMSTAQEDAHAAILKRGFLGGSFSLLGSRGCNRVYVDEECCCATLPLHFWVDEVF